MIFRPPLLYLSWTAWQSQGSSVLYFCSTASSSPLSIRRGYDSSDRVSAFVVAAVQVSPSGVVRSTCLTVIRHRDVLKTGRTTCSSNESCRGRSRR